MHALIALCAAAAAGVGSAQVLTISSYPSQSTARLGDVVTWTVIAELDGVPADETLLAAVVDIGFNLNHGGDTGIELSNNTFAPSFFDFFVSDNGTTNGDAIEEAIGVQTLPPLGSSISNANPLSVYSYDMLITDDTPRTLLPELEIVGQFSGAYEGTPFPQVFTYQNADGSPGNVPFQGPPLLFQPFLTIVPAPASVGVLGMAGLAFCGHRRA